MPNKSTSSLNWGTPSSTSGKADFVKLRHFRDFETGFCNITAIVDVELVFLKKHTKYFILKDALKIEEIQAFHYIDSSNTKDDSGIPFPFISEEG